MRLTKSRDLSKYGYSTYGIGFDALSQFLKSDGDWGKNVVIFKNSMHVDNKKRYLSSW